MALNDLMDSKYLAMWRDKNLENRKLVNLGDITATEDFQLYNSAAQGVADCQVNGFFASSPEKKISMTKRNQFNLIVHEYEEGKYHLLAGVSSFMFFNEVNRRRKYSFDKKKKMDESLQWKEPRVKVFVAPFETRAELISHCKDTMTITFKADINYLLPSNASLNADRIEEERKKMMEDKKYLPVITAYPYNGDLYITENAEGYAAAKERCVSKVYVCVKEGTSN